MSNKHPFIILFDIDGTLLTVDRNFNRPLLRRIIDDLEINYPSMESDPFSGRTDYDIITSFLVNHNFDEDLYKKFKTIYLERLNDEIKSEHVLRHNFIDEALSFFDNEKFINGLLTGNYPSAAYKKLEAASIEFDFKFGAFGEFHKDRNMLPKLALQTIGDQLGIEPDPSLFIIIGDTLRDIECAKANGMKCVAVATGKFSSEQLAKYDPDLVIQNLSKPEEWFAKLIN